MEGGRAVNVLLEGLAGLAARRHWVFIIAWVIILGGLLAAKNAFGGEYVNNYTISGSDSAAGLNVLNRPSRSRAGTAGRSSSTPEGHGRVAAVGGQPVGQQRLQAAGRHQGGQPVRLVQYRRRVQGRHDRLRQRRLEREPGLAGYHLPGQAEQRGGPGHEGGPAGRVRRGRGEIGQKTSDIKSEVIGLACALVLLLIMFWSLVAAAIPLVSAIFSVLAGLALLALLARVVTFPTTGPTIATLLGLGVAVDYGLFMVARHREQLDAGMGVLSSVRRAAGTSGAAIVVAGSTVAVSVLGLYISGVGFVGALGLAAALVVVVTMISALTLVPAFMGLARESVRALTARVRARKEGLTAQQQAAQTAAATHEQHEHSAFARWGRMVSAHPWPWAVASVAVLVVLAIPLFSITLGQPDNGTNPTSDSSRQAYDLISQGFGVGVNGPLTVVVKLPNQSSSANSSLLSTMQSDIAKTAGGVGHPRPGELGRHHRGVQRHPDHPAAGHADHRPGEHAARHGAAQGARD